MGAAANLNLCGWTFHFDLGLGQLGSVDGNGEFVDTIVGCTTFGSFGRGTHISASTGEVESALACTESI